LAVDRESETLIECALGVVFENGTATRRELLMRKLIFAKLKEVLERKNSSG
jgi:hypothetical protein